MKEKLILYLKGVAMGAADVVPGVSGGTIAFISGIYETLLSSIQAFDKQAIKMLLQLEIKNFWQKINGNFLLTLLAGIGTSIISLAKLVTWLLEHQPVLIWSFFFGLVVASAITVAKKIQKWDATLAILGLSGAIIAYWITVATPAETPDALWFVFFSGAIAICAMILPGISGSFILLLLKKYHYILSALTSFKIDVIITFIVGAIFGLLSFSRVLKYLLHRFHDATIVVLTGFMVGSLNAVYPWKIVVQTYTDRHGIEKPLIRQNVSPFEYESLTHQPAYIGWAILLAILGVFLVFFLEHYSEKFSTRAK
ncbi:MAG: DUF368 domain-containing protein [Cytophagales bacterium]|nr:DUF368 domain-containing protein [Cytophagales bacterium]MDW8384005.1 DUF368 domain-containing protein [Flammeovirgaceae bacterium]